MTVTETDKSAMDTLVNLSLTEVHPVNESTRIHIVDILDGLMYDLKIDGLLAKYLRKRTRNEGLNFLCKILPKISTAVLHSIECGGIKTLITHNVCKYVRLLSRRSPFRVLICDLFDADGTPSTTAVGAYTLQCLIQLCDYFKKLELPNETKINYEACLGFVQKNKELGQLQGFTYTELELAKHISDRIFPVSYACQHEYFHKGTIGDGPGTFSRELPEMSSGKNVNCAELKRGKVNNVFDVKHKQYKFAIKKSFPEGSVFRTTSRNYSELLLVPKTASSARVIVREPKHILRLQKAFFTSQSHYLRRITNGRLNLFSQAYNQERALSASIHGDIAVMDVRGGSNSVSHPKIRQLAHHCAPEENLLDSCRTTEVFVPINWESPDDRRRGVRSCYADKLGFLTLAREGLIKLRKGKTGQYLGTSRWTASYYTYEFGYETPNTKPYSEKLYRRDRELHRMHSALVDELKSSGCKPTIYGNRLGYVVKLHMLAGMGSYLTFCYMMRYFHILLVMSAVDFVFGIKIIHRKNRRTALNKIIDDVTKDISIYGDDIELPKWLYEHASKYLASHGVIINMEKSFSNSKFRESCGPFYYNGYDVTPLRCSLPVVDKGKQIVIKSDNQSLVKLAAHASTLKDSGFTHTARVYRRAHNRLIKLEHRTGILASGLASHHPTVSYAPDKGVYRGLCDEDRWKVYWLSKDRYELTSYGEALIKNRDSLVCNLDLSFLNELPVNLPAIYAYKPMGNPTIPKKGRFIIKKDVYNDVTLPDCAEGYNWSELYIMVFIISCIVMYCLMAGLT